MKNIRVIILRLIATILLIFNVFFTFNELIRFSDEYIEDKSAYEEYRKYISENITFSEGEAYLIQNISKKNGFSISDVSTIMDIMIEHELFYRYEFILEHKYIKDIDMSDHAEKLKYIIIFCYYLTIIVYVLTFIFHFLGTKCKGVLVLIMNIIWFFIAANVSALNDAFVMSYNITIAIILIILSAFFWKISYISLPEEKRYTVLEIVKKKKKCWIERFLEKRVEADSEEGIEYSFVTEKKGEIICSFCYTTNRMDAVFCKNCGNRIIGLGDKTEEKKSKIKINKVDKYKNTKTTDEKILNLSVIYNDSDLEEHRTKCMKNCSMCNAENVMGAHRCIVCGENF